MPHPMLPPTTAATVAAVQASFKKRIPVICSRLEVDVEKPPTNVELRSLMELGVRTTVPESLVNVEQPQAVQETVEYTSNVPATSHDGKVHLSFSQSGASTNDEQQSSSCRPFPAFRVIRAYINTCQYVGRADIKLQATGERQPDIASWTPHKGELFTEYKAFNGTTFCVFSTISRVCKAMIVLQCGKKEEGFVNIAKKENWKTAVRLTQKDCPLKPGLSKGAMGQVEKGYQPINTHCLKNVPGTVLDHGSQHTVIAALSQSVAEKPLNAVLKITTRSWITKLFVIAATSDHPGPRTHSSRVKFGPGLEKDSAPCYFARLE
ncbi:hypothetical protein B0H13DRAFT_1855567 [Mycena leptocephala]|nr:hypothetical protein B0H13DRAFT_1855567 [Mycena leptocephala]